MPPPVPGAASARAGSGDHQADEAQNARLHVEDPLPNQRPWLAIARVNSGRSPGQLYVGTNTTNYPFLRQGLVYQVNLGVTLTGTALNNAFMDDSILGGLAVGDVTRDGTDEVIFSETKLFMGLSPSSPCPSSASSCTAFDRGNRLTVLSPGRAPQVLVDDSFFSYGFETPGPVPPFVAVGDFDQDSIRVRATGQVYAHSSRPFVNAVLAAPPTFRDVPGVTQASGSSTSFGTSTSMGTQVSANVSVSTSITISAAVSFFDLVGINGAITASAEATYGLSYATNTTVGSTTSVGEDSNLVLDYVFAWASHEYEVVSHPDPRQRGTLITVDVPAYSARSVLSTEGFRREFCAVADEVLPPTLFQHRVGDPFSYGGFGSCAPYRIEARVGEGTATASWETPIIDAFDVGNAANATNTLTVTNGTQTSELFGVNMSVDVEAGASLIVGATISVGTGAGASYETIIGSDVTYSGTVASLSAGYDLGTRYKWGLCVFNYTLERNNVVLSAFPVVTYVVARW